MFVGTCVKLNYQPLFSFTYIGVKKTWKCPKNNKHLYQSFNHTNIKYCHVCGEKVDISEEKYEYKGYEALLEYIGLPYKHNTVLIEETTEYSSKNHDYILIYFPETDTIKTYNEDVKPEFFDLSYVNEKCSETINTILEKEINKELYSKLIGKFGGNNITILNGIIKNC